MTEQPKNSQWTQKQWNAAYVNLERASIDWPKLRGGLQMWGGGLQSLNRKFDTIDALPDISTYLPFADFITVLQSQPFMQDLAHRIDVGSR